MNARLCCIAAAKPAQNHAGSKARIDIDTLVQRYGMQKIPFRGAASAFRSPVARLKLAIDGVRNWARAARDIPSGALVLMQYPHYPIKSARYAMRRMQAIRVKKQCRFAALIHDLNSVREPKNAEAVFLDSVFLKSFDFWICHNERMREHLIKQGFDGDRITCLTLFDYLYEQPPTIPQRTFSPSINIAGNLAPEKAGYLYELLQEPPPYALHLYGVGYAADATADTVVYHGAYPAEALCNVMEGAFGLVWDGDSVDTCSGSYGEYLRLNNPHKASLYLSCGMPVIIWKQAALAPFIEQNRLGFAAETLDEIPRLMNALSSKVYEDLCKHAAMEANRIRCGYYFSQAISELERT